MCSGCSFCAELWAICAIPQKSKHVTLGQQREGFLGRLSKGPSMGEEGEDVTRVISKPVSIHIRLNFSSLDIYMGVGRSEVEEGASSASQFQQGSVATPDQGTPPSSCRILVDAPGVIGHWAATSA